MGVSWTTLEEWADILYPYPTNRDSVETLAETAANVYKTSCHIDDYSVHDALREASEILGISDLHNDEDGPRYNEYEETVYAVEKLLGIVDY